MLAYGVSNKATVTPGLSVGRASIPHDFPSSERSSSGPPSQTGHVTISPQHYADALLASRSDPGENLDVGLSSPKLSRSNAANSAVLPFESLPPAADDDFEWDERESSWNLSDSGGRNFALDSGIEIDVPKLSDGMATLAADSNTGFFGSVSGAALLRLIWMSTANTDGAAEKSDKRDEHRKYLEQLFEHQSIDHPSPSLWLRTQPLLTRAVIDTLVDAYFALYHPTFPILHEPTFREQYSKLDGRPGGSTWNILASLVAALGSFVSSTCSDDTDITLFNAVKARLSIESLETGNLTLVQAFAMAANYLQKRNRPNSGYNYGGIALRLAISLGLHKEFHGWETTLLKKEIRRRVWWSLCVLDVGSTVTYGRPLNWPQVGIEAALPLNIHEEVSRPLQSSKFFFSFSFSSVFPRLIPSANML